MNKDELKGEMNKRSESGHYDAQTVLLKSIQTDELGKSIDEVTIELINLNIALFKNTDTIIKSNEKLAEATSQYNRRLIQLTIALVFVGALPVVLDFIKFLLN